MTIKHLFKISSYIHLDEYLAFVGQSKYGHLIDETFALMIQGLVMASFHPILDYYLPKSLTKDYYHLIQTQVRQQVIRL